MILLDLLNNKKEELYKELQDLTSIEDQVEEVVQSYSDQLENFIKSCVTNAEDEITDIIMGTVVGDWDEHDDLDLTNEIEYVVKDRAGV